MSKFTKIVDGYLFAPSRYLTAKGNIVGAGRFHNALSVPETKIGGLTAVALAFSFTLASGSKDLAANALYGGVGIVLSNIVYQKRREKKDAIQYYFDTTPERSLPIPTAEIVRNFELEKYMFPLKVGGSLTSGAIAAGVLYSITKDLPFTAIFTTVSEAGYLAIATSDAWYARQALKGNWNVLTSEPEIKVEEKAVEQSPVFAPSLS